MQRIIGIDLGTTNSCVAIVEGNTPIVIPNQTGHKTTPSIVAINSGGKRLVGQLAKRQAMTNPAHTVNAVKRLIGRRYQSKAVQMMKESKSYSIVEDDQGMTRIALHDRLYSPAELSSMILLDMKNIAEKYFGEPVDQAVITVPAYFNDAQRQATKEAGEIAGLDILRIINEPTAAALAYGYGKEINSVIAVYDLGGGTFDFSILEISDGVFEVLATSGDTFLGGEDFDDRIILHWLVADFAKEHRVDLRQDKMALQRLKDAAETAKCELSSRLSTEINLPFIISRTDGETLHLQKVLTRNKLEELTRDLVERSIEICRQTIKECNVQVDEVVVVGGMTRMPLVQSMVRDFFQKAPRKDVHPDEVVALGAAIQGMSLGNAGREVLLLDVTPMSLGIMIAGGAFSVLIPKNTTVPTSKSHIFTTIRDQQDAVRILVLQGESEEAIENDLLGEFSLTNIRPAPRGEIEFEVTFQIDSDGIVSVNATNLENGQQQAIVVTAQSGLSNDELQKIARENQDYLVGMRQREHVEYLQQKIRKTLLAMERIMPRVKTLLSNSEFADEALHKAEEVIQRAKTSVEHDQLEHLERDEKALNRTLNMFHNVIEKMKR